MATVVLFHHVQGRTEGVIALAEALRQDGHTVHVPDLFEGALPGSIEDGMALVEQIGDDTLGRRAEEALAPLPAALVYAGISLGAGLAQRAAQTRPGAQGALLYEGCLPVSGEWAVGPWPEGLPVQVHGMDHDPYFAEGGDLDAARELVEAAAPHGELFVYPGDRHLFTDRSLPSSDEAATALVLERSRAFLARVG